MQKGRDRRNFLLSNFCQRFNATLVLRVLQITFQLPLFGIPHRRDTLIFLVPEIFHLQFFFCSHSSTKNFLLSKTFNKFFKVYLPLVPHFSSPAKHILSLQNLHLFSSPHFFRSLPKLSLPSLPSLSFCHHIFLL